MNMDWSAFWGAFTGLIVAIVAIVIAIVLIIVIWDRIQSPRPRKQVSSPKKPSLPFNDSQIAEKDLEGYIVSNFGRLFPGWTIYDPPSADAGLGDRTRPKGVQFSTTGAGKIDILALDNEKNFVVIELKVNRTPDTVLSQVDRYITWVEQNLATADQTVRGIIIAKHFHSHLAYSSARRNEVELWNYEWDMILSRLSEQGLPSLHQADAI